ncbi:hypothetical protein [Cellulomonas soli]|uniref:Uncharacterized protein n=1 Tax=Cellulomonas soli TaxID=931535 RepID=A0A512PE28_9CELL|nr:hypothetical protein [Cellulomonas soli]NYI59093.1 hypothetical protein [Cellulomonas soli]GEP69416.1 hypothetical protein CSO01_21310 [Cellulomonas soli]
MNAAVLTTVLTGLSGLGPGRSEECAPGAAGHHADLPVAGYAPATAPAGAAPVGLRRVSDDGRRD